MNKRVHNLLIIILLILIGSSNAYSQKLIALDKPGKVNRIRYFENDIISLKTIDGAYYYGNITAIKDSSFIVNKDEIYLSDIKYIQNTQRHEGWELIGGLAFRVGIAYFIIDSGNHLINGEAKKVGHPEALLVSGIAAGVFIISNSIANRKYRINKNRHLKLIDLTID